MPATMIGRPEIRTRHRRHVRAALAWVALPLAVCGCSKRPDWSQDEAAGAVAAAEVLGEHMRAGLASAEGPVVLVHDRRDEGGEHGWVKGLASGLDGAASVEVCGPQEWPEDIRGRLGGTGPLAAAIEQYPDAAAFVSTVSIGGYERPSFPGGHPPLYALEWAYLPESAFLFAQGAFSAGVFQRPLTSATLDVEANPSSARELFDRDHLLVTGETLRECLDVYRQAEQEGL